MFPLMRVVSVAAFSLALCAQEFESKPDAAAFAKFKVRRALVIGVETDMLFPIEQQEQLATVLARVVPQVQFHRLASLQGHDAFLVDMDRFRPLIARYFER